MQYRWTVKPPGDTGQRVRGWLQLASALALAVAVTVLGLVGCARSAGSAAGAARAACGTTRTAANVPVRIEVTHGHVTCATALRIEQSYATAIRAGEAPGNGGGGPVKISGWTCEGFSTPTVLQTGQASKCILGSTEILATLPAPA